MIVAGLTGSMGMGKSTVAAYLRMRAIPMLDADRVVHDLYAGDAAPLIEQAFPATTRDGIVDRAALARHVLASGDAMQTLERIIHPLVRSAERDFLAGEYGRGSRLAFLEIPLLYETGSQEFFDVIVVVSAPPHAQRERVLARPGMTHEKFASILARQWPDSQKREKADFIVDTGTSLADTFGQIDAILSAIEKRPGTAIQRWLEDIE